MGFFHGHPTATVTDIFHCRQLVFTDVFGFHVRGTAETAIFLVSARVAQMSRGFGDGAATFTCICHDGFLSFKVGRMFYVIQYNDVGMVDVKPLLCC
jgi:hypothetical protein